MSTDHTTYQAYLIRFTRSNNTVPWRITIQDTEQQQKNHFGSMEDAVKFLEARLEEGSY